jgi:DNA-binding MarR family transcriptional regulator
MLEKDQLIDQVLIDIRKIVRAIDIHSSKLIKSYGLTVPQTIVLKVIESDNSPTVGEIANSVSLSQATITNIVTRLEQRGYVTRTQCENDKRRVLVKITEKGRETIKRAPSLLHDQFTSQFQNLKKWEQLSIISSLQHVAEMMDAQDIEASPVLSSGSIITDPVNEEGNLSLKENLINKGA